MSSYSHIRSNEGGVTLQEEDKAKSFIQKRWHDSRYRYLFLSLPVQEVDPLALLEVAWQDSHFQYYWEHPTDDFSMAAGEELLELSAAGPDRFQLIRQQMESLREKTAEYHFVSHSYAGQLFLGGFAFQDHIKDDKWQSFSAASFTVPKWAVIRDGKCTLLTISVDLDAYDSPEDACAYLDESITRIHHLIEVRLNRQQSALAPVRSGTLQEVTHPHDFTRWKTSVNRAKCFIDRQAFQKIVLARQVSLPKTSSISPTHLVNMLRRQYTKCYNFLLHRPGHNTFLGSTPERLASFRNQFLLTEALAGSIQRGETAREDAYLANSLLASAKNKKEHDFVVRDIEQRLTPLVKEVQRGQHPEIKKLTHVQHLYTPIRGHLNENVSPLEVVEALHPTPAVGGYPRQQAIQYIAELESFNRGWYAGPVGWINAQGQGDFAVAIRSGLLTESEAHFFAGCGIVADSDAAAEWEETNLKLKPMLSVLQYD